MLRQLFVRSAFILLAGIAAQGQESSTPEPQPSPKPRNVRLTFLPPPMDGTLSLGIYDAKGKLVRILHREADIDEFNIGADALLTTWDGKDDQGEDLPAGRYHARGFVVGELGIEGIGSFFNDWITADDSPRFSRIQRIALHDDKLLLDVELVSHTQGHLVYDPTNKTIAATDATATEPTAFPAASAVGPGENDPIMTVAGRDDTRWVVDRTAKSAATTELKQFSATGEFLRRLTVPADQPQPTAVAPSLVDDRIYLLEENNSGQRLRGLALVATNAGKAGEPVSDWKVDFEKSIVAHRDFTILGGKPVAGPHAANPPSTVKVKLPPNPLLNEGRTTVEIAVGFDVDGSFLKTSDGLPLCSISETPGLIRTLLTSRGSNSIDLFQDDGAVVEQFRVTGLDRMMSFDAGSFELK